MHTPPTTTPPLAATSATAPVACGAPVHQQVLHELHRLPDDHRQILLLKLFEKMTLTEISDHIGIDLDTVRARATCGIRTLAGRFRTLGVL